MKENLQEEFELALADSGLSKIKQLLKDPDVINMHFKDGETLLHITLRLGIQNNWNTTWYITTEKVVELLLTKMSPEALGAVNDVGQTALHYAVKFDFLPGMNIMNIVNISPNSCNAIDEQGRTAFFNAVVRDKSGLAHMLLNKMSAEAIMHPNDDPLGNTALHYAALNHYTFLVEDMLNLPYEYFAMVNKAGNTALQLATSKASSNKFIEMFQYKTLPLGEIIDLFQDKGVFDIIKIGEDISKHCKSLSSFLHNDIARIVYEFVVNPLIINPDVILGMQHEAHIDEAAATMHVLGANDLA